MINTLQKIHPSIRPILLGVLAFFVLNAVFTIGVTLSPLNRKFNFSYGNFLPTKLDMLKQAHPEKLDVLFLGTSQTNNGFITSVFEQASGQPINSFNLGLPNNRYDVMLAYLQMHTHRYGKPKMVLVELSPSIQEKDASLYYLPALYYRSLIEKDPALANAYLSNPYLAWNVKQELLLSSFSSLHQYRFTFSPLNVLNKVSGKLKNLPVLHASAANAEAALNSTLDFEGTQAASRTPSINIDPIMTEKGWYPKEQSPHMTTPDGIVISVEEARKYYIASQQEVNFDKLAMLLAYCRQQKIPVVLVTWPNHPAFVKVFAQSKLNRAYQQGLSKLLAKEPVHVINLNQELPPWQTESEGGLFADPRHLTPEGAKLFSEKLALRVFGLPLVQAQFTGSQLTVQKN